MVHVVGTGHGAAIPAVYVVGTVHGAAVSAVYVEGTGHGVAVPAGIAARAPIAKSTVNDTMHLRNDTDAKSTVDDTDAEK